MRVSLSLMLALAAILATVGAPGLTAAQPADQVRLSLDRYDQLQRGATRAGAPQGQWTRGTLSVQLPEAGGRFATVVYDGAVSAPVGFEGPLEVPVLPADVALTDVKLAGAEGALSRAAGVHVLVFSGKAEVHLAYTVPVLPGPDAGFAVVVPVPPAPSAAVRVDGPGKLEAFPLSSASGESGHLEGTMPSAAALLVRWGADQRSGLRRVDYTLRPDASGDGVEVTATYEVLVGGGGAVQVPMEPATVALSDLREGTAPVASRVEDEHHVFTVSGRGRHAVTATWRLAVDRSQGQPQVTLHPAQAPMARVEVQVEGKRQVSVEPPVPVRVAQRGNSTVAVGDLPPVDEVTVGWTETRDAPESQARTNTETYQLLTLAEGVLRARVLVSAEVIRGKLKELAVQLPEDVVVYKVLGEGVRDWQVFARAGDQPRLVRVFFAREMDGQVKAELQLEMRAPQTAGSELTLPLLRPLGAFREMGVVALLDGDKVGFGPATAGPAFTSVGEDALPPDVRQTLQDKVGQAFKHVGEPGPLSTRVVAAAAKEVRFDARVLTLYQVKEGALVGNAQIMVELKSGRQDHLRISLPEGVAEPRINAPSLNKFEALKDPAAAVAADPTLAGRKVYDVRFTQALEGAIQLDVELEMLLPKELGSVSLPDVRVHGAEVEEGSLAITAETGVEVQPGAMTELRRVEVKELPNALALRSAGEIALGYHFVHAPWSLALTVKRHQTVETLNASAAHAWIETSVLENGHLVTRAVWSVANDEKQFLRVTLPKDARVLTVRVAGESVRAVADESGAIAVPLPKGRTVAVEVSFETVRGQLGWLGRIALEAPHPDVRTSDVQWLVCTPADVSILSTNTDLKESEGYAYRRPAGDGEAEGRVPCDMLATGSGGARQMLYTWPVEDAADAPLSLSMLFTGAGGEKLGAVLTVLALLGLGGFMWRRAHGRQDRGAGGLLGLGLVCLLLLAVTGGLSASGAFGMALVLLGVGYAARRHAAQSSPDAGGEP